LRRNLAERIYLSSNFEHLRQPIIAEDNDYNNNMTK